MLLPTLGFTQASVPEAVHPLLKSPNISSMRSAGELALMTDSCFMSCPPYLQILAVFWQNVTMNSRTDF